MSYKPISMTSLTESSSSSSTSCSKLLDSLFSSSSTSSDLEHYELFDKFESLKTFSDSLSDEIAHKENEFSKSTTNENGNLNEIFNVEEGRQGTLITREFFLRAIFLLFCRYFE